MFLNSGFDSILRIGCVLLALSLTEHYDCKSGIEEQKMQKCIF